MKHQLKKVIGNKTATANVDTYTAAVTIMYNNVQCSHVERFKVRLINSYDFNIFLNFFLSYILTNSSDIFFTLIRFSSGSLPCVSVDWPSQAATVKGTIEEKLLHHNQTDTHYIRTSV